MSSTALRPALYAACLTFFALPRLPAEELPLSRVTLFNAGIGFYQHSGNLSGDSVIELPLGTDDLNDVLKTLVLSDPQGGPTSLDYDSRSGRLAEQKQHLRDASTLAELLQGLRGEMVHCVNPNVQGRIVSVERREGPELQGGASHEEYLTLLTETGLTAHPINSFGSIQLQDPQLRAELEKALTSERKQDQRTIRLHFHGKGARDVGIGYLRQSPVWKPTHRLILGDKPKLQTWAVVENTSAQDWNQVQLTLVGGSPISFRMSVSEPRMVSRQHLPLPYSGIPLARVQESGSLLADASRSNRPFVTSIVPMVDPDYPTADEMGNGEAMGGARPPKESGGEGGRMKFFPPNLSLVIGQTEAMATAGEMAHYYKYELSDPLSLPAGRSAMAPVLAAPANATSVSLYQPDDSETQLLHAIVLTNETDSHWAAGPIAVFKDNQYAGESQLSHCPPGARRVLAYAADLSLEARRDDETLDDVTIGYKIEEGQLVAEMQQERMVTYQFLPRDGVEKQVLIEHSQPADGSDIVEDKAVADAHLETTDSFVRYQIKVSDKGPTTFRIREMLTYPYRTRLDQLSLRRLDELLEDKLVSPRVAESLQKLRAVLHELEQTTRRIKTDQAKLAAIAASQTRVRQNMDALVRDSELYKQYVALLTEQEREHKTLSASVAELAQLQAELKAAHKQFGPPIPPDPFAVPPFAEDANPFE